MPSSNLKVKKKKRFSFLYSFKSFNQTFLLELPQTFLETTEGGKAFAAQDRFHCVESFVSWLLPLLHGEMFPCG